jgi:hypothetical protein
VAKTFKDTDKAKDMFFSVFNEEFLELLAGNIDGYTNPDTILKVFMDLKPWEPRNSKKEIESFSLMVANKIKPLFQNMYFGNDMYKLEDNQLNDFMKMFSPFIVAASKCISPKKFINRYFGNNFYSRKRLTTARAANEVKIFPEGSNADNHNVQQLLAMGTLISHFTEIDIDENYLTDALGFAGKITGYVTEDHVPRQLETPEPIYIPQRFNFNNFKNVDFQTLIKEMPDLDKKLHERQVLTPFLLMAFFNEAQFFKNPIFGGSLSSYFDASTSKPIAHYGDKRAFCIPDMLIEIIARIENGEIISGMMLIEAIDEITVEYMFENILRHETFAILGQLAQIQIVKDDKFWRATARVPSMIARMSLLLTTNDFWIITHILNENYETIKQNIESEKIDGVYQEFTLQTFIKYFGKYAESWISENMLDLGKQYDRKNKFAFAEKIQTLFGYKPNKQSGLGTLEPFMYPYYDKELKQHMEILIDMEMFWIQFNYAHDPPKMMEELKIYFGKSYGKTAIDLMKIRGKYQQSPEVSIEIDIPEDSVKNRGEYLIYLGRIKAALNGRKFFMVDSEDSRMSKIPFFIENYDPNDPKTHIIEIKTYKTYTYKPRIHNRWVELH